MLESYRAYTNSLVVAGKSSITLVESAGVVVQVDFNNVGIGGFRGYTSDGTTLAVLNSATGLLTDDIATTINGGLAIKIEIPGHLSSSGNQSGSWCHWSDEFHVSHGNFSLGSSSFDPMTSIQFKSKGGVVTIDAGTRIVAYAINKD